MAGCRSYTHLPYLKIADKNCYIPIYFVVTIIVFYFYLFCILKDLHLNAPKKSIAIFCLVLTKTMSSLFCAKQVSLHNPGQLIP